MSRIFPVLVWLILINSVANADTRGTRLEGFEAENISLEDDGEYYNSDNVEEALQEIVESTAPLGGTFIPYNGASHNPDIGTHTITAADAILTDFDANETVAEILNDTINPGILDSTPITNTGGLDIEWGIKEIYTPAGDIVETVANSGTVTDDKINHLFWASGTELTLSITAPDSNEVGVAHLSAAGGEIWETHSEIIYSSRVFVMQHGLEEFFPVAIAPATGGLAVTNDTDPTSDLDVTLSAGEYYHDLHEEHIVPQINSRTTLMVRWHQNGGGGWVNNTNVGIDTASYNSGTGLISIPNNQYVLTAFKCSDIQIHWIYATTTYPNQAQALSAVLAGVLPDSPEGLELLPWTSFLIYKQGDTDLTTNTIFGILLQNRPEGVMGALPSNNHATLTNLNWDVAGHTINTDLDLNSNNILEGGSINSGSTTIISTNDPQLVIGYDLTNPTSFYSDSTGALTISAEAVITYSTNAVVNYNMTIDKEITQILSGSEVGHLTIGNPPESADITWTEDADDDLDRIRFTEFRVPPGHNLTRLQASKYYIGESTAVQIASDSNGVLIPTNTYIAGSATVSNTGSFGDVGIGTTEPRALLEINGGGTTALWVIGDTDTRLVIGDTTSGSDYGELRWDTSNNYLGLDADDTQHLVLQEDGGNVGIGTVGPVYKLDVQGGAIQQQGSASIDGYLLTNSGDLLSTTNLNPGILVFHGTANSNYGMDLGYNSGTSKYRTRIFTNNTQDIAFGKLSSPAASQSDFTEWMTIEAGGNVGIGTIDPQVKLDVEGAITAAGAITCSNMTVTYGISAGSATIIGPLEGGGSGHDQFSDFVLGEHFTEASIDHTVIQSTGTNTHPQIDTAITNSVNHIADNSQAHTDYLINNGDDSTTGHLTAKGLTATEENNVTSVGNRKAAIICNKTNGAGNAAAIATSTARNVFMFRDGSSFSIQARPLEDVRTGTPNLLDDVFAIRGLDGHIVVGGKGGTGTMLFDDNILLAIQTFETAVVPLNLKGVASQTAPMFEIADENGNVNLSISKDGDLTTGGELTASGVNVGDAGGFSGIKFNAGITALEFWIDGSAVSRVNSGGDYQDLTP